MTFPITYFTQSTSVLPITSDAFPTRVNAKRYRRRAAFRRSDAAPISKPSHLIHSRNRPSDPNGHMPPGVKRVRVEFDEHLIDPNALKVVRRLLKFGFEAYLVGGGVRDLLLHQIPKDFDVVTSARPEQVRQVFRNSRIIGRRFRLVHVVFGYNRVVEVATFRKAPENEVRRKSLLIRRDNEFGSAHEDARRRDLTINALLYDVRCRQVLDFVGGTQDIENRVIRTIGDPCIRFLEDPVRMLRSVKFCARLDLGMVPELYDAIVLTRHTLLQVARARLLEELLKILRSGYCLRTAWLLWETGILHVIVPEVAVLLDDDPQQSRFVDRFWNTLSVVDETTRANGEPLEDLALITLFLYEPLHEAIQGQAIALNAATAFLAPIAFRFRMSRKMTESVCKIVTMLHSRPEFGKHSSMQPCTLSSTQSQSLHMASGQVHAVLQRAYNKTCIG